MRTTVGAGRDGGASGGTSRMRRRSMAVLGVLAVAFAATLTACSTGGDDDEAAGGAGQGSGSFPVTMEHVYGETEIREKPERIVTIGWITHDIVAALGTAPVGVDETWGGDDEGFSPWFRDQVENVIGGDMPELTDSDDGSINIEKIAATEPDLILAPHSGVTDVDYGRLSDIAPTVAYRESPWQSGSWQELTETVATALGEQERGRELIEETETAMEREAAKHPNLDGASFVYGLTFEGGSQELGLYVAGDPRVAFLREFGLVDAPGLAGSMDLEDEDSFFGTVSLENIGRVETDLFVGWSSSREQTSDTLETPAISRWEPVEEGNYYILEDETLASATNGPSPLSIRWALDEGFLEDLSEAVDGGAVVRSAR
ncbi:ABC-type iron-siderophore transporter, substrate-binding lipoprotein [Corynebacterium glyciniphilum AJ 3170]|uniref:ABC-type iron-siderophore transporter, substrate-binding lipoprotein n=1 Tax=Corynebacterium glyciniphilum AJ 3170 TaxID=1404245 RepID=X5EFT0_9CORY|nr:iron-siderophore ABC transporter substrate-binding protein [Corynebacterium glyciniphilum]AHW65461.1 ABC-type iron-siderophore transporter, substrate-binding lipoprotein [Corynebacterium glyciniphilum AJ 3170]